MANLTGNSNYKQVGDIIASIQVPIYASETIYQGAMVCLRTADGYAVKAGTASTGRVVGVARAGGTVPSTSGAANINLLCGVFCFPVNGSSTPTIADVGKAVYASDDNTISNSPSAGPVAGTLVGFEATTGNAMVYIAPPDAGAAGLGSMRIPIASGILAAGTPMAAFADNAGASAPGITIVDSEGVGIRWNNQASQTAVWTSFMLPRDIDTSKDATLVLKASKTGATVGDATKFTITAFNNATGALHDADADFGGDTTAMTGNATAKTVQSVTLTLAAADLGLPGDNVSLSFKPKDGTLGTDDCVLFGIELQYRKKS